MNSLLPDPAAPLLDRIKTCMVGLKMPRAIEAVSYTHLTLPTSDLV